MTSLGVLDIAFFAASLAGSVLIGLFFASRNKTMDDFMLGGRDQRLLPVGLSMMTSFVSGLTIIGGPAEIYYHGIGYATYVVGMTLWAPLSAYILLPVFYNLGTLSVNSYLEHRYHVSVKRLVSVVSMVQMTLYNAVVLYVPSLSLQSVLGVSEFVSIGAVGLCCILYSSVGGIKAVIWTDFFQAGLMYLSMLCIIVTGVAGAGGWRPLLEAAVQGERLSFRDYFNTDLHTRHTIFTITLGCTLVNLFINGCNQVQVQRALSLPSLRKAQQSQMLTALFSVLISLMASCVGVVLYGAYRDCDPFESGAIEKRDSLLIYYVQTRLAEVPGLRGMFIAGIFAATLSTLSSFQNSMSALMLEDVVRPFVLWRSGRELTGTAATRLGKLLSLAFGVACVGATFVVGRISGLLAAAILLFGALGSPFMAAFLLGMTTRFVNTSGVLVGMLSGFSLGIYVQMYQLFYMPPLEPTLRVSTAACPLAPLTYANASVAKSPLPAPDSIGSMSYLWVPVFAFTLTCVVGCLVSLLTGGCEREIDDRYLATWMRRKGTAGRKPNPVVIVKEFGSDL